MAAETWFSAQEAVELGLADRVEQPIRMAAHFDLSRFRNAPPLAALSGTSSTRRRCWQRVASRAKCTRRTFWTRWKRSYWAPSARCSSAAKTASASRITRAGTPSSAGGPRRRSGASGRTARAGARGDLSAAGQRSLQLSGGYLRARIVGTLGGRAAEEIIYGTKTTGAENDIEQATNLARTMVTRWGMSEELGLVQLAPRRNPYLDGADSFSGEKPFSEETAHVIDTEIRAIISESYDEAKRLLSTHRNSLDAPAEALLAQETLDEKQILDVTGLPPAPALETGRVAVAGAEHGSAASHG
jgi:hypothetical protein